MGILDEAIREHLDLKRRHGAAASELEQLEQEAFGPPTRPGEPDFPDRSEEDAEGLVEAPFDAAAAETTFMPAEETAPRAPTAEIEATEADEAMLEPDVGEAEAEPPEGEPVAPFFDQNAESEVDLGDLELELEEEAGIKEAPAAPIESLETEEHRMDELLEEEPPAGEPAVEGDEPEALLEDEQAEEGDEESDVLEETPEFLRDQPEDDELWFEQGEPKDFDF